MTPRLNFIEIANALATLVLMGLVVWAKVREKRLTKSYDLDDNPDRCKDHEDRLRSIEKTLGDIKGDIKVIRSKVGLED